MIEVEKNFDLRPGDKERLIAGAAFLSKKTFTDVYYDFADFRLTTKDYWLRQRDGRWELKMSLNKAGDARVVKQYREVCDEKDIARELGLDEDAGTPLAERLQAIGCAPFAVITTTRESYQSGKFRLDFDEMDFGFSTFEAELMVEDKSGVPEAEKKILEFAEKNGISSLPGEGKVIRFLELKNPAHLEAIRSAGRLQ